MSSKIKKKIPHKIIWDRTEKVVQPRQHHPSPHLLDLRTHQHATVRPSSAFVQWCSRIRGRVFSVTRAPYLRLPSILRRSTASLAHAIEFLRQPPSLASRIARAYPQLSVTAVGTVLLALLATGAWIVHVPITVVRARHHNRTSFLSRFLWPFRFCFSTVKYWLRRTRLLAELWRPDREVVETVTPRWRLPSRPRFIPLLSTHQRALAIFACFAFVIILPLQFLSSAALPSIERLTAEGSEMIETLTQALAATEAGEWEAADRAWSALAEKSEALGDTVYLRNPLVRGVGELVSEDLKSGYAIVEMIQAASEMGRQFSLMGATMHASLPFSERVERIRVPLQSARASLGEVAIAMRRVDSTIVPAALRPSFDTVADRVPQMLILFDRFSRMSDLLPSILGAERPMRYLVVFQNDAELRPSGGFIGSLAVVDVSRGAMTKTFVPGGGSYDMQGSLRVNVQSPPPLQHVNARWEFQDSNWWSDFPTTVKKLLWFWDEAGGPTVDGVIAVNASLVERLLALSGPVALPEYGKVITSENFYDETHRAVEVEYDRVENTPKRFIADLFDAVLRRLSENGSGFTAPMILEILDAIERNDIMIVVEDATLQEHIAAAGMDGALAPLAPYEDGVHLVIANIGGEKTDRVMQDALRHEVVVDSDTRSLTATATLTRVHRGVAGVPLTGVRNRSYVRVYLPLGSSVLSAEGFMLPTRPREVPPEDYAHDPDLRALEAADHRRDRTDVFTELGRTVVGGWMELDPGEVHTVQVTYRLPWTVDELPDATYRLRFQRQSGYDRATVDHSMIANGRWSMLPRDVRTGPRPFTHDEIFTDVVTER